MIGFILFLLWPVAFLTVCVYATAGWRYPWWLVTPDDPVSPFGQYEPRVRSVYARYGKWAGDVYWLGTRNVLYGLAYWFKPDEFKRLSSYTRLTRQLRTGSFWRLITVTTRGFTFDNADYDYATTRYHELTVYVGPVAIILGRRLWPVYSNDGVLRHPNMDARPTFSVRLRRNA